MRAIKSSELRIGNWIIDYEAEPNKTIYWQVETIEYLNTTLGIRFRNGSSWTCEEFIEPIKLTEEWLLKFGFEEVGIDKRTFCSAFIKDGVRVTLSNGGNVFYGKLFVQSVHQLQNLYFSLTGEELTFTKDK